tara:strand:+ start:539 stop:811 length:273 start_codon:yes stop_codon:yes gene_type:complete
MNKRIKEYLEHMINDYIIGNERTFKKGDLINFCFEDCEKLDDDLYDEKDIMEYLYVKHIINKEENCFLKRNNCLYKFEISEYGIECSFIL